MAIAFQILVWAQTLWIVHVYWPFLFIKLFCKANWMTTGSHFLFSKNLQPIAWAMTTNEVPKVPRHIYLKSKTIKKLLHQCNFYSYSPIKNCGGWIMPPSMNHRFNPFPVGGGRGLIGSPFWKMWFTQNFTKVLDYIIVLLFIWIPWVCFDTFFGILPHMGPMLGAPKVEKTRF